MNKILLSLLFMGVFLVGLVAGFVQDARADILITPTRVVFGERDNYGLVTLANNGDKVTTYKIGWKFFEMQAEGAAYKPIEISDLDYDVSEYINFSPRQVTLQPGASQKVRLALRRPSDIPDGDFHVHLGFSTVPDSGLDVSGDGYQSREEVAGMSVMVNIGYTIPVVVRSGVVDVSAEIGQIALSRNKINGLLRVAVPINRAGGAYSVLGHLMVFHVDGSGNETRIGEVSNAHIFPEVDSRTFDVQLTKNIDGGSLRVVMYDYLYDSSSGNNAVYAEKTFPLE